MDFGKKGSGTRLRWYTEVFNPLGAAVRTAGGVYTGMGTANTWKNHWHGIVRAVKAVAAPQALPAGQSDWYDEDDLDSYVEWEA